MLNKFSKYYLFSFWLLLLGTLHSQYDTTHYIPYLTDLTGNKKMASLERNASVYNFSLLAPRPTTGGEGSGGAYIMFSTFEPGPFYVRIYKRNILELIGSRLKYFLLVLGPHLPGNFLLQKQKNFWISDVF